MNNITIANEKMKEYFYNRFKNADYETTLLELKNVNERERIINELAENQNEAFYYNGIYERMLKNISVIFKNNDDYIKAEQLKNVNTEEIEPTEEQKTEWEQKRKELKQDIKSQKFWDKFKKMPISLLILLLIPLFATILLILGYFKFALPILS